MSMTVPMRSFTLANATQADIARLAEIHVIACLPDNAFALYFDSPAEFDCRIREMLVGQVGIKQWLHLKAIDTATGEIVAWASWNMVSDDELRTRDVKAQKIEKETKTTNISEGSVKLDETGADKSQHLRPGDFDFPPGLPAHVHADTERWLKKWTQRRRHIQCKALFTDPSFRRRGIGSALVQAGNEHADRLGLPIFLQASPYGFPVYSRFGFHTTEHLDVDLCKWAPAAAHGDKGYGNYRFRYMLRLPEPLPREKTVKMCTWEGSGNATSAPQSAKER